ncbi:hypothetical protein GCM10010124_40710 [Pilimelia terevasa]|uniref:Uncharacterized protein n=1 Tax=Pilimelia terevasa TaxID=53372 RepID=A0A8J3BR38_9ACTN|nr:hypothetical protein [Pilimelia terevasa]GGK43769.1 hypothetical protein GCM10010124_40710 [Pilimelia terevasa]
MRASVACLGTVAAIADFGAARPASAGLLDQIRARFELLSAGPDPLTVDGAALGHGLPPRRIGLPELTAILLHPATSFAARDAVWRNLIDRARTGGPGWVVGAVGVALPGLRTITGRLARAFDGDVAATVVAEFVAVLRTLDPGPIQVVAGLLNATHAAARASLRAATPAHCGEGNFAPVSTVPPAPFGHPDFVLARAVHTGVITGGEAELIGVTRLEDVPVAAYAARLGVSASLIYKRRTAAEGRLVAALRGGELADDIADVVADATGTLAVERP